MKIIRVKYLKIPVGELIMGSYNDQLCLCDWRYRTKRESIDERVQKGLDATFEEGDSDTIQNAHNQLIEYLNSERTFFDVPLLMLGTAFQKSVWAELLKIPFGKTETYLGLSQKLNNEGAIRAVASANGANAISIFIPCHRVIGSNGELTGYAGGLSAKRSLLQLESKGLEPEQLLLFK